MQCDVHLNRDASKSYAPFLLDVQADLFSGLDTRVIVPLIRAEVFGKRVNRLHPMFDIQDQSVVMATHLLAAVRRSGLGNCVGSLDERRDIIISAIDVLLSGV